MAVLSTSALSYISDSIQQLSREQPRSNKLWLPDWIQRMSPHRYVYISARYQPISQAPDSSNLWCSRNRYSSSVNSSKINFLNSSECSLCLKVIYHKVCVTVSMYTTLYYVTGGVVQHCLQYCVIAVTFFACYHRFTLQRWAKTLKIIQKLLNYHKDLMRKQRDSIDILLPSMMWDNNRQCYTLISQWWVCQEWLIDYR